MTHDTLPVGKLPVELLARLLAHAPVDDPRVILGPGIGLDCAVVEVGDTLLVLKSDPITFVSDAIGGYLVQVNANDVATTGATPRWLLITLLLPERHTTVPLVEGIFAQVHAACRALDIAVIGGHTEITHGLDRPLAMGTLIGEVTRKRLVTPRGAMPGDRILLTKGVPIEAVSILAREFPERVRDAVGEEGLRRAREFLADPGISVVREARAATEAGRVTAMHDPTEGGLAAALWELAQASGRTLAVDLAAVPVPELAARLCAAFHLDPLAAIASGALLLTAPAADAPDIRHALERAGVLCADIGEVHAGAAAVYSVTASGWVPLPWPKRDALARMYDAGRA